MVSENVFKISDAPPVPEWLEFVRQKFVGKLATDRMLGHRDGGVEPIGYTMEDLVHSERGATTGVETWLRIIAQSSGAPGRFRLVTTVSNGVAFAYQSTVEQHHYAVLKHNQWWTDQIGGQFLRTIRKGEEAGWPHSPVITYFKGEIMRAMGIVPVS